MFLFNFAKALKVVTENYIVNANVGIDGDLSMTMVPFVTNGKLSGINDFKNEIAIDHSVKGRIVLIDKDTKKYYNVSIEVSDEYEI